MPLDNLQPIDDGALLDTYSRAVISVVDRIGLAIVRVEPFDYAQGRRLTEDQDTLSGIGPSSWVRASGNRRA